MARSSTRTAAGRDLWLPLLLAVLTFLVYLPSLQSDFVYDARKEILEEGFITSLANVPAVLTLKVLGSHLMLGARPGQLLYLMFNASVWGTNPWGYHLSSNLLHAVNVALLFVLMRRLVRAEAKEAYAAHRLKIEAAMAAAALIFGVHPIAVETVSAIGYSSDLLVAFFTLLALLAATSFRPDDGNRALGMGLMAVLCSFAAVTCKESGLAASLLLIAYWFLFRRGEARGAWLVLLGSATALTGLFLAARLLWAPPAPAYLGYLGGSFFQVFLIQPRLWVFMMGALFWPTQLSADYTPENMSAISSGLGIAVLLVVLGLQVWLVRRSRIGALGVAIYWLGLATVSNFIPLYCMLGDRFYYLPLAGVALQLLALLLMVPRSGPELWFVVTTCLVALLPLTLRTLIREDVFADQYSLWSDTVQVSPFSTTAHYNFGNELLRMGKLDEAMAHYQKALELSPDYAHAHNTLGIVLAQKGQPDEALTEFRKAHELDPTDADTGNNLGEALLLRGDPLEAREVFLQVLKFHPEDRTARENLGKVQGKLMMSPNR